MNNYQAYEQGLVILEKAKEKAFKIAEAVTENQEVAKSIIADSASVFLENCYYNGIPESKEMALYELVYEKAVAFKKSQEETVSVTSVWDAPVSENLESETSVFSENTDDFLEKSDINISDGFSNEDFLSDNEDILEIPEEDIIKNEEFQDFNEKFDNLKSDETKIINENKREEFLSNPVSSDFTPEVEVENEIEQTIQANESVIQVSEDDIAVDYDESEIHLHSDDEKKIVSEKTGSEETPQKKSLFKRIIPIAIYVVLGIVIAWLIIGLLINAGYIDPIDIGYSWFNETFFRAFFL